MGFLVRGLQLQGALVFAIRAGPLPFAIEQLVRHRHVGLRKIRIDAECAHRGFSRQLVGLFGIQISVGPFGVRVRQAGVG